MRKKMLILVGFLISCSFVNAQRMKAITYNEHLKGADSLEIREGILSQHALRIKYKRNGKKVATITLTEPILVAMAEREESWGYFQFPGIGRASDGSLRITWQMNADSHKAYGTSSGRENLPMWSYDEGKTWKAEKKNAIVRSRGYNVGLADGSCLQVITPASKNIRSYEQFPQAVDVKGDTVYFKEKELPDELRGVYFTFSDSLGKSRIIHSKLDDLGLLRSSIGGFMPIVWWGNIKQLADGTLVAGVYPATYLDNSGQIMSGCVSFYYSKDKGKTWEITGKISPVMNDLANLHCDVGFTEPAFELLNDSTFICVLRSGSTAPMYKTFSADRGRTWTMPVPFTPNGVKPDLMLLKNGVLVLSSGRPGVQLRLSLDGKGKEWTDPIDMIPYLKQDGSYNRDVSCGYVSVIESGKNSFLMVYSDFTKNNKEGQVRKSIWVRRITVKL